MTVVKWKFSPEVLVNFSFSVYTHINRCVLNVVLAFHIFSDISKLFDLVMPTVVEIVFSRTWELVFPV